MKSKVSLCLLALGIFAIPCSAVTLNLSGTGTASATFVQNRSGVSTNGLTWGLLVADSTGTFATNTAISSFTGSLVSGASFGTSSLLFAAINPATTNVTKDHTDFTTSVVTPGAALSMAYTLDLPSANSARLAKLIWFDGVSVGGTVSQSGTQFFGVGASSFALPTTNSATLTVTATDGQNGAANVSFGVIPEPSAALLGALGALGLLRRRRN
jgi:hypothetical protein